MDYIAQYMYFLHTVLHTTYSNREYKLWQVHSFYHAYETHELKKNDFNNVYIPYRSMPYTSYNYPMILEI